MASIHVKGGLKCTMMVSGGQSVMTTGAWWMRR